MLTKLKNFFFSRRGVIVLVIIAVIVFFATRSRNGAEVKTATVERGEVTSELVLPGEVKAKQSVMLTFPGSGKMASIAVTEGQKVTRGQYLGKMDTVVLNSLYQQALATRRNTQAVVDKIHDDLKDKAGTETFSEKATRTAAEVANDQAYETLIMAQKNLQDATFVSPINGVVAQIGVKSVGSSVAMGTLAFQIIEPSGVYFSVAADQTESGLIKEGQSVEITLDAFDNQTLKAIVNNVALTPTAGQSDTVYDVSITDLDIFQIKGQVRVGMTGDGRLITDKKENVLYLDSSYIKSDLDGKYVLVGPNKEKRRIEVGLEGDERVEIISGVSLGDVVYQK